MQLVPNDYPEIRGRGRRENLPKRNRIIYCANSAAERNVRIEIGQQCSVYEFCLQVPDTKDKF